MTFIVKISVPVEGFSATRDYDIHAERIELQGLIVAYMTHMYEGDRITLSAPLYPSQTADFPKVKFCNAAPGHPCVCTAESIAKIRPECLTCGTVSDTDRRLMTYEVMAHPDSLMRDA